MRNRTVLSICLVSVLLLLSAGCGSDSDSAKSRDGLAKPWSTLNLEIEGAQVVRSSGTELQLVFPFIKPDKISLPYAKILDAMKKAGWKVLEQDYGKEGMFESPDGKKYGMEVFAQGDRVVANLWAL